MLDDFLNDDEDTSTFLDGIDDEEEQTGIVDKFTFGAKRRGGTGVGAARRCVSVGREAAGREIGDRECRGGGGRRPAVGGVGQL